MKGKKKPPGKQRYKQVKRLHPTGTARPQWTERTGNGTVGHLCTRCKCSVISYANGHFFAPRLMEPGAFHPRFFLLPSSVAVQGRHSLADRPPIGLSARGELFWRETKINMQLHQPRSFSLAHGEVKLTLLINGRRNTFLKVSSLEKIVFSTSFRTIGREFRFRNCLP